MVNFLNKFFLVILNLRSNLMKKLAICIPTYNRAKLLDRLLKSIPSLSSIVVSICDDGSKDNTLKVINRHKSRISIRYIYQKNEGRASHPSVMASSWRPASLARRAAARTRPS